MKLGTSSRGRAERAVAAAIVICVGFATTIVAAPHAFATPITYVVDSTADTDGNCDATPLHCTLREAINSTEGHAGHDTITFSVTGTIAITASTPLPQIRDAVTIDATNGSCAPTVELDGTSAGSFSRGLYIIGTDGTVIRGLAVNHFDWAGIDLSSTQHTHIECNYLGLALDGTTDAGNTNNGIHLDSDSGDVIGGSAATRNVLSGNDSTGIRVTNASLNTIAGNYIGTNAAGTAKVPNNTGIFLSIGATNNTIGTTTDGPANIIANNGADGIIVRAGTGNRIETHASPDTGTLGIDLPPPLNSGPDGVTPNDANDVDTGGNGFQNFPPVTTATFN